MLYEQSQVASDSLHPLGAFYPSVDSHFAALFTVSAAREMAIRTFLGWYSCYKAFQSAYAA